MSKHPLILRAGALALAGALLALSWTWFPGRPSGQAAAGPAPGGRAMFDAEKG